MTPDTKDERSEIIRLQYCLAKILLILWGVNMVYGMVYYPPLRLPMDIVVTIAERVPAIGCPWQQLTDYKGNDRQELLVKADNLGAIYSFTLVFGTITGIGVLIWWTYSVISHLHKTPYNLKGKKWGDRYWGAIGAATVGLITFSVFPLLYVNYYGDCDILFDSYITPRRPGAFIYITAFWGAIFWFSVSAYIYASLFLRKRN